MDHFNHPGLRFSLFACLALVLGCSSSENDRLKRMMAAKAKAKRDAEEATTPVDPGAEKKNPDAGGGAVSPDGKKEKEADSEENSKGNLRDENRILRSAEADDPEFLAFKKKMLEAFEERARNMNHFQKLERVAKAFAEMVRTNRVIPGAAIGQGEKLTLSWRVELLPFLGYPELYEQFDLKRRFNSPVNARLVELIPPEFQTCTEPGKTNIVVPIASYSMFSNTGRPLYVNRIEDGVADTVAIVEADDPHAQVWTAPEMFMIDPTNPLKGLGEKYGFVVTIFGDGRVEKASKSINASSFVAMLTYDAGDSFPTTATQPLSPEDFGLHGFGPKQQLVMQGAGGAIDLVGNLTEAGVTRPVDSASSPGQSRPGETTESALSLADKLMEGSLTALRNKDLAATFDFKYASLILGAPGYNDYRWCAALQRPVLAPRWSVGVLHPANWSKYDPLERTTKREQSRERPGDEILEEKTGQVGLDAMIVLRNLVADGKFGKYLTEQIGTVDPLPVSNRNRDRNEGVNQTASQSSNSLLVDSRKIPDLHYPGIEIHEGTSRSYHLQVAKDRGNDLLLLIEIDVRNYTPRTNSRGAIQADRNNGGNAQNRAVKTMQVTTLYVIDVQRNRELWKSAPLNSVTIREERKNALKEDAVFVELKDLDQFCRENVALTEMPQNLTRDNVLRRLKVLEGLNVDNKLPLIAEAGFYLNGNLIQQTDYTKFCIEILGKQDEGLNLAVGNPRQRFELIRAWLPLQYSLELSR